MKYNPDDIPCYYIGRRLRWAGIHVSDEKEKYGTWRVYCDSLGIIQEKWYRHVYKMAIHKFPDQVAAILLGADYTELLIGLDPRLVREQKDGYTEIRWLESSNSTGEAGVE